MASVNGGIIRSPRNYRLGVAEPINFPMFPTVCSERRATLSDGHLSVPESSI
jgi:hypothetical protein